MEYINLQIVDFLPAVCKEAVVPNEDGSYTVFINERLSDEKKRKAYEHAMRHIRAGDFSGDDVDEIERMAHYGT